jgi:hypothetical protein
VAAAVIEPLLGFQAVPGTHRGSVYGDCLDQIGDSLVRAGFRSIALAIEGCDRSEADQFAELADRLEQGTALRAQIANKLMRVSLNAQADLARFTFVVGH